MTGFPPRLNAPSLFLGAFCCALAVAYLPAALNAATAGRWAVLAVGLPVALSLHCRGNVLTVGHAVGALLLGWAAMSMAWTPNAYDGLDGFAHLLILAMAFMLGGRLPSLLPIYCGLGLGLAVNSGVVVGQGFFGLGAVYQKFAPAGLFMSKNWLGEAAVLVLIGIVGHRRWWLAASVLPCVVLTTARGAMAGLLAAALMWLLARSRAWLTLWLVVGTVLAVAVEEGWRREWTLMTVNSVEDRWTIWLDTIRGLTWLGRGIGSYYHDFPSHSELRDLLVSRPSHAHNDFLEILYELGAVGALLGAALAATLWRAPRPIERAVLTAFIVEACFGFPSFLPVTGSVAAIAAGRLSADGLPLRGGLARWGMALRAWALEFRRSAGRLVRSSRRSRRISA